jgi:hypothetical protein
MKKAARVPGDAVIAGRGPGHRNFVGYRPKLSRDVGGALGYGPLDVTGRQRMGVMCRYLLAITFILPARIPGR